MVPAGSDVGASCPSWCRMATLLGHGASRWRCPTPVCSRRRPRLRSAGAAETWYVSQASQVDRDDPIRALAEVAEWPRAPKGRLQIHAVEKRPDGGARDGTVLVVLLDVDVS